MTGYQCRIQPSAQSITFPVLKSASRGQEIRSKTILQTSQLWICCSFMTVVFPCSLQWCFGGTGRRATPMLARFKGFDSIVKSMFRRLYNTGPSILSPELFVRCVWSELLNTGTIIAPSGHCSHRSGQYHHSYDEIQLRYLFIPPPVTWFHHWVDTFLSIIEILC